MDKFSRMQDESVLNGFLKVKYKSKYRKINLIDILLLESKVNYTFIYLNSGEKIVSCRSLSTFEKALKQTNDFMRPNRSQLIKIDNIAYVSEDKKNIVLCNEQLIPISRRRKKLLDNLSI